ncbi:hypothetical protein [Streptococcus sp. sy018]|uniref:hypothetical protein n=1 Tax=Streptococcus sp. sy018 TaxID=2600147 RepID=UPI0011B4FBFB|nr:hypothetical protein [Streptococcus sp. sy018]TWS95315.1 hypothetical protein FRX52_00490 [Streptococcus sp. sy018]
MGELERLAQDLRRTERELKKGYIWLSFWCFIFIINFIWGSWSFLMSVYDFKFLFWLFVIPVLLEPFFYSFLLGVILYSTVQGYWKRVEKYEHERSMAELYLDSAIRSAQRN